MTQNSEKARAAQAALSFVEPGMRLGLGTGSTAELFLEALAGPVSGGLDVVGVPTSARTEARARELGIPVTSLDEVGALDLTVDGADEVGPGLALIKGGGGALLREKIVAAASARMVVVADASKRVDALGAFPLPVEIVPFGAPVTKAAIEKRLSDLGYEGAQIRLRQGEFGEPFVTDGEHYILDCALGRIADPAALAAALDAQVGVVEHGLFLKLASCALIAGPEGVTKLEA